MDPADRTRNGVNTGAGANTGPSTGTGTATDAGVGADAGMETGMESESGNGVLDVDDRKVAGSDADSSANAMVIMSLYSYV